VHPFQYIDAKSLNEAISLLAEHGPMARCLSGGTDILVHTRTGRFDLDLLIDIKAIPEVAELQVSNEGLRIGAAIPCYRIYENEQIVAEYHGIVDAATLIGGIQIQSRATFGGNLCNASPSADGICPLIVHQTVAIVAGPNGTRQIPVGSFCTGPGINALESGEILVALQIPKPPRNSGSAYERFIPRNEMDIAVAGVASAVTLNDTGEQFLSGHIALAAVGPTPIYAEEASRFLSGKPANSDTMREAGALAARSASPITDMRGDADQRRHLVKVLTERTLTKAIKRAQEAK
jgi:carbon-monoxide dehydrogenase medium subunit